MLFAAATSLYAPLAPRTVREMGAVMGSYRFCRWKFGTLRDLQRLIVLAFDVDLAFPNGLLQRSQKAPNDRAVSCAWCTAIGARS